MKYKMRISAKIMLLVMATSMVIMFILALFVGIRMHNTAKKNAIALAQAEAEKYANLIKAGLETDMGYARAYAHLLEIYINSDTLDVDPLIERITKPMTQATEGRYFMIFNSLEISLINPEHTLPYGRRTLQSYMKNGIHHFRYIHKKTPDGSAGDYAFVKANNCEMLYDPYLFDFEGHMQQITSVSAPIQRDNHFSGIAGVDVSLAHYQNIVNQIHPYANTDAALVANNGTIIAHTHTEYNDQAIGGIYPIDDAAHHITEHIKDGIGTSFYSTEHGERRYVTITPITVGQSPLKWAIYMSMPMSSILHEANRSTLHMVLVFIAGILLQLLVVWRIARIISTPIRRSSRLLNMMAKGNIDPSQKLRIETGDEMEEMARSTSKLIDSLNDMERFARAIESGNLDVEYTPLSSRDTLGKSLIAMRESLVNSRNAENQRKEEEQRQVWHTQGTVKFGEILRQHNDNIDELSYLIIKNLVQYTNSIQGGIYMVDDTDPNNVSIEMSACYAYDRRKYLNRSIKPNEGLVGRCYIERKTIFMRDIPQDYMKITSGLGQTNPSNLIIVPLLASNDMVGIIEMASMTAYEQYQRDFIEHIANTIAGTLTNVRINLRTNNLLMKTQQQAEMMHAQEEEMRQNMEELHATQEEMERKREEQDRIQAQLLEDKAVLRRLLDTTSELVYHKNKQRQFVRASAAAMRMLFGIETMQNLRGHNNVDLLSHDQAVELTTIEEEAIQNRMPIMDHPITLDIDGKPCQCQASILPIIEHDDEIAGLVGIIKPLKNNE